MTNREQQFKELFLSEYNRMFKAAYILLNDEEEAKDVVQDVFAKLWAGTIPLREESQKAFLLTCVRNRCLNIIARNRQVKSGKNGRIQRIQRSLILHSYSIPHGERLPPCSLEC